MAILFLAFLVVGSAFAGNNHLAKAANNTKREYGQIKNRINHRSGPPDYAPAHGYRAKYQYHYYPRSKVYYDTARKIYFYLKGENWEVGVTLPGHLKNGLGEYVSLELETSRPYLFHEKHHMKYSPKKSNSEKKQLNVFTKLWILLFAR